LNKVVTLRHYLYKVKVWNFRFSRRRVWGWQTFWNTAHRSLV